MKKLNLAMKMKLLTVISGSFLILMTAVNIHAKSVIQDPSKVKVVDIDEKGKEKTEKTDEKAKISISKEELDIVAEKVFRNEAAGKKSNLVHWNVGENFPSLGIGHFIWYKQGDRGKFEESLPQLVKYFKSKNVKLPEILEKNEYAPWTDREELLKLKEEKDPQIEELTEFLYATKDIQIEFIYKRLENSLGKILEAAKDKENVRKQFYRVANSPNGLYPLIDYINFKGEGTNPSEGYKGEGWGLLQVLENMKGSGSGKAALVEFSNSAKYVLQRRVDNSDPARNEQRWLPGWFNRCDTYKDIK